MALPYSPWDVPLLADPSKYSNFESFLQAVTPSIPTQQLPTGNSNYLNIRPDQQIEKGFRPIFSLRDVWKVYSEWSCFGTGVPILLNSGDSVLQYYSPSLSALQIYTIKPNSESRAKKVSDCWSDSDKKPVSVSSSCITYATSSDDSVSNSDHEIEGDRLHQLYCQYNETASPYERVPLTLKINELARIYLGLMKLQSLELSPYSWMAVAWYPIYQIPVTRTVNELSACFITYHALSSSQVADARNMGGLPGVSCPCKEQGEPSRVYEHKRGVASSISEDADKFRRTDTLRKDRGGKTLEGDESSKGEMALPPFAVATYKMHGELWTNPETSDKEKIGSYLNAASSWLRHRKFHHHDFNFFMSRR